MIFLITGNAGSGKSSVADRLAQNGQKVVDTDLNGYSHWYELATGNTYPSRPKKTPDWPQYYHWYWNLPKIQALLGDKYEGDLFLCGLSFNQFGMYPQFDKVFFLEVTPETLKKRLAERTNNPFGKRRGDVAQVIVQNDFLRTKAISAGAIMINANQPLDTVIKTIQNHAQNRLPLA